MNKPELKPELKAGEKPSGVIDLSESRRRQAMAEFKARADKATSASPDLFEDDLEAFRDRG